MTSAAEVKEFYANDVVYRFDRRKKIIFGVVVDSYESSDSDESHALQKGQIRVYWLNNSTEQVWKQNKVKLMSRSVIPGDIVRRLEQGKETQRGYCRMAKQYAAVQIIGTDKVIENVSQDRLTNVLDFDYGTPVCLEKKFGRIQNFEQKITMLSKCGSIVEILQSINCDIEDYWLTKRNRSFVDEYHAGQEVTAVPSSFEQPNWIKKSKTMKRNFHTRQRFTIQKVDISNIEVAWHAPDDGDTSTFSDIKDEDIPKLKLLEIVEDTFLELAERRLLKITPTDALIKKRDWILMQSAMCRPEIQKVLHVVNRNNRRSNYNLRSTPKTALTNASNESRGGEANKKEDGDDDGWSTEGEGTEYHSDNGSTSSSTSVPTPLRRKHYPPRANELAPGHTVPVEVLCMDSKATIVWQDGTEEKDVPTTQLYYSISLDDHEFFPGEWVVANDKTNPEKYGVVQKVDYLERTATIKWFTYSENEKKPLQDSVTEMSVYDITKHPKFAFRPGSTVYNKPVQEDRLGTVIDSCPQGFVNVKWLSGIEEACWPQDIELLPDPIDFVDDTDDEDNGDISVQVSWETESIESVPGDITYEPTLQNMAARLDFVRSRIVYLKEAFKQHTIVENFGYLRDLLVVYDNSSYLDKLLDTSFFSVKSKHYQALLQQVREKAKQYGVELRGRLFTMDNQGKAKTAERENINKVLKLEHKINAQIENAKDAKDSGEPSTPVTPDIDSIMVPQENLCVEILSMLKARMDLAYAEIIARIGGTQALSVMTKASEPIATPTSATPLPSYPTTPDDSFTSLTTTPPKLTLLKTALTFENETYSTIDDAPSSHRYYNSKVDPTDKQRFFKAVQKEGKLLRESLPPGVWVRSFANRLDLLSVMIRGPNKTPYEDGLFLFDIQLSVDYPRSPPLVSYISYSSERLNPNLYVEGRVCVSLLGTWLGRGTEVWGPNSTLLQLIVSIQGLILVSEPYYNEAGYEKQSESQQGYENSRTYNELVVLKLVQSMTEMLLSPPVIFKQEILGHFSENGEKMVGRLKSLINDAEPPKPEFPLLPVSKGLKLSLNSALDKFQEVLKNVIHQNALIDEF